MKNPALLEEIKTYRGRDEVPEDFDAFWDGEVKNVSTPPSYHLEERDFHIPQVKCYELTFEGSKEGKVYARIVLPKSEEKVPLIFHFHGYMGRGWDWADMLGFTVAGYGVVSMDVRPVRLLTRRLAFSFRKYREGAYYPWCYGRSGPPLL